MKAFLFGLFYAFTSILSPFCEEFSKRFIFHRNVLSWHEMFKTHNHFQKIVTLHKSFHCTFKLDGPKAGQVVLDDEPDFYDQAYGA